MTPNEFYRLCLERNATENIDQKIGIVTLNTNSENDNNIKELEEKDDKTTSKNVA